MLKPTKLISIYLATLLLASLFLVSGANSQVADTKIPHSQDALCSEENFRTSDTPFELSSSYELRSCIFPEFKDISDTLTREDIGRLSHIPGYDTNNQTSIQEKKESSSSPSRSLETVNVVLFIDEEARTYYDTYKIPNQPYTWAGCCAWAKKILDDGSAYLEANYDVGLRATAYVEWTSPNSTQQNPMYYSGDYGLLSYVNFGHVAKDYGCDMVVIISGQQEAGGSPGIGYTRDRSFIIYVKAALSGAGLDALFQHEESHLFNCKDGGHTHSSSSCPCVMCGGCSLGSYLGYCSTCDWAIWRNRVRFEAKGYGSDTAIEYIGSGRVYNKDNIAGNLVDRNYANLYSGGANNRAVLYVNMYNVKNPGASLSGTIYLRGYSASSGSHLYVTASNDKVNWWIVKEMNYYTPNTESTADDLILGHVNNFKYLAITVVNDKNYVSDLYFDTVRVF